MTTSSHKQCSAPLFKRIPFFLLLVGRDQCRENDYLRYGGVQTRRIFSCGENSSRKSSMVRCCLIHAHSNHSLLIRCHLDLGDLKNSEVSFSYGEFKTCKKKYVGKSRNGKHHAFKDMERNQRAQKLMATYEVDHIDEYNKCTS